MEYLLKIVEGPMKGAEIALVEGVGASFGSGESCDIVVQDATVPAKACEFEVDASGVRMAVGGGSSELLPPFEIRSFGTTSFAVGPVTGEWQALIKPTRPALERADPEVVAPAPSRDDDASVAHAHADAETDAAATERPPHRKTGLLAFVIFLLLLVALGILVWYFWPKITAERPSDEKAHVTSTLSLADIARQHGLQLKNGGQGADRPTVPHLHLPPTPTLSGNLRRRTERLAIRALALAADPNVKFDLTDDETLFAASSELIFACSDGALKVDVATNRTVALSGYAPSRVALEKAIRALNADVKGIEKLDTHRVRVGGTAPATVAGTPFVREEAPGEYPVVAIPAHTPNPPSQQKASGRDYPIAGILTAPYPCVVMRNGVRLVEGAQLGKAVLVKIETDRLTLKEGGSEIVWRP